MTPQECVLDAVLRAQGVLAEYIEPGPRDCAKTLSRLFVIFADDELTNAANIMNLEAIQTAMQPVEAELVDAPARLPPAPLYDRTSR
jgi:hypothetical protein